MADLELNGVIKLTADTTEAEKKAQAVGSDKRKAAPKSDAEKDAKDAAKAAEKAAQELAGKIKSIINDIFGGFGRAATGAFGKASGIFANIGSLFGKAAGNTTAAVTGSGKAATAAQGAATAAGAAGTGASAAGGAAGAAGSAVPALAGLGPVGIAAAAMVAAGAAAIAAGAALIAMTEKVMAFGRDLATVSPSMAGVFAQFDRSMMMLKQQLGELIAPSMGILLNTITDALTQLAPVLGMIIVGFSTFMAHLIVSVQGLVALNELMMAAGRLILNPFSKDAQKEVGADLMKVEGLAAKEKGIPGIIEAIAKFKEAWEHNENRKNSGMVMTEFMKNINADGSAQRQYQDAFRLNGPAAQPQRLFIPPP